MTKGTWFTVALMSMALMMHGPLSVAGESVTVQSGNGPLCGTLELPSGSNSCPVALIISGSGPTDRDGNNPIMGKNNSLKLLAQALAARGIGSLRFDKRGIGESAQANFREEDLRFEDYIDDAVLWCEQLRKNPRFSRLVVIGHSEGSLIGMVVCRKAGADGFVSIAGLGSPASTFMLSQLKTKLPEEPYKKAEAIVRQLEQGLMTDQVPAGFSALFRPSVQPYLISWFKYDPSKELASLKVPILVIQGSTDIQVPVDNAKILAKQSSSTDIAIIKGMNHVLKEVPPDLQQQLKSYGDPSLPVAPGLVNRIATFIQAWPNKSRTGICPVRSSHQREPDSGRSHGEQGG